MAHGGGNRRLAVDKLNPDGARAPRRARHRGLSTVRIPAEQARLIKSPDEIAGMTATRSTSAVWRSARSAIHWTLGHYERYQAWSELNRVNVTARRRIHRDNWCCSLPGQRACPWFRECSDRVIEPGDLVDRGCRHDRTGRLLRRHLAHVRRRRRNDPRPSRGRSTCWRWSRSPHNMELCGRSPVLGVRRRAWNAARPLPAQPIRFRLVHGAGLCGEYPYIAYPEDFCGSRATTECSRRT